MPENVKDRGGGRRRIRVLLIISSLTVGGTQRQLVYLAKGLDPERFRVVVCCLSTDGPFREPLVAAGIPVVTIGFAGFGDLRRHPVRVARPLFNLVRLMRSFRPDVVHGFLFWSYVVGTIAARFAGVPAVVTGRRAMGAAKVTDTRYLFLDGLANRLTDLVVANSEAVRADTLAREHLRGDKVKVIYNGLDAQRYHVKPDDALKGSLGLVYSQPVVGVIASLLPYKGHHLFLDAWKMVIERCPKAVALLVGDGPMRRELEARVDAEGLGQTVRFLGTRHDIPELLAVIDIVAHSSFTEGLSNAILEAMAAGKPVVAASVEGNLEAVVDGSTGFLVAPRDPQAMADAIVWLAEHQDRATAFGEAARGRVARHFDLRVMVGEHERMYELLLLNKRGERLKEIFECPSRPSEPGTGGVADA